MGNQHFPSEMYCVTVPKRIVQESFNVSLIQISRTFCFRWIGHDFFVELFCLTVPKKIVHESFSVSRISCVENIYS